MEQFTPDSILHADDCDSALAQLGAGGIARRRSVGTGHMSRTEVLELADGRALFVKQAVGPERARAEAEGLRTIARATGPRVPEVYAVGSGTRGFLIMEYIPPGRRTAEAPRRLGAQLARMHAERRERRFGFERDNYIGSMPQHNGWLEGWTEFFAQRRLLPQVRWAAEAGLADRSLVSRVERICGRLPELIAEPEHPSLLHGDLWGGNVIYCENGEGVLIDPAVYYGHRETDLAMTELFGGFDREFYEGYEEVYPLDPGYRERVELYNLYHMLNHLNIFGRGYKNAVRRIVDRYQR